MFYCKPENHRKKKLEGKKWKKNFTKREVCRPSAKCSALHHVKKEENKRKQNKQKVTWNKKKKKCKGNTSGPMRDDAHVDIF